MVYVNECNANSQWRNRRGGGGVRGTPETSDREIADLPGKERQEKKGENGAENKETRKREGEKLKI